MNRLLAVAAVLGIGLAAPAADWTHWRGPHQNGTADDKNLPDKFSPATAGANNLVWKAPFGVRSAPVVMNGRVFIINKASDGLTEQERVLALDAKTGALVWEHKFNVFHTDIVSSRLGFTNPAGDPETGYVYTHGTQGLLYCFDRDGKVVWKHSLTEEYARTTGYGGRIVSPTVVDDLVVVGMINSPWGDFARGANRFVAFDKRTGSVVWWSDPCGDVKGTYYSNPAVATINGEKLLVTGAADGQLVALQASTGKKAWAYQLGANVINASPVVNGSLVYISHGEENPEPGLAKGRVVCVDAGTLDKGKPKLVWEIKGEIEAGYTSPLLVGDRLYVADDKAKLHALDAATGKPIWRRPHPYGRLSRGSPVYGDGKIYVFDVNARFHIIDPSGTRPKEVQDLFFPNAAGGGFVETNGTPAIADGRVYFGTADEFYCIGKPDWSPAESAPAPAPAEKPAAGAPAWVQVVPADVAVKPGESVTFKAVVYDAKGVKIGEEKADWSLPQPPLPPGAKTAPPPLAGEIRDGTFAAAKVPPGQQGYVLAKVGALTGRARVRVVPQIPYKQDFEKSPVGTVPGGWVNATGKYAVAELGGSKVLKKLANNPRPPLARVNAYITAPTSALYDIECDVSAQKVRDRLPDMGVINTRYVLQLEGKNQVLTVVSWDAVPRLAKTVPFAWKEDAWYRMKLVIDDTGKGSAVVRGKVWPRGEKEPENWTVEVTDPVPNTEGAAGLYGYSSNVLESEPGSEMYYDNLVVAPKKK